MTRVPSAHDHVLALMDECPCVGVVVPLAPGRRGLFGAGYWRAEYCDMEPEVRCIMAAIQATADAKRGALLG